MREIVVGMALLAGLAAGVPARAEGPIYLCVDAAGRKELTDVGGKGNCKMLDLPGLISSPARKAPAPARSNAGNAGQTAPPATPATFPKVDNAEQKARDADRRRILLEELESEQQKLAELKKEYNGGQPERQGNERNYAKYQERVAQMKDNINRAEQNVEALKREMATIR